MLRIWTQSATKSYVWRLDMVQNYYKYCQFLFCDLFGSKLCWYPQHIYYLWSYKVTPLTLLFWLNLIGAWQPLTTTRPLRKLMNISAKTFIKSCSTSNWLSGDQMSIHWRCLFYHPLGITLISAAYSWGKIEYLALNEYSITFNMLKQFFCK